LFTSQGYLKETMKVTIIAASLVLQLAGSAALHAQEYVVAVSEENFRARPNGTKLGTLVKGASVDAVREQGRWIKASLRGWIWKASLRKGGDGRTVVVSRASGENLRATPAAGGKLLGTVLRATPLIKLGERKSWVEIRYDGWIWQPSLSTGSSALSDAGPERAGDESGSASAVPLDPISDNSRPGAGRGAATPPPSDRTLSVSRENLRATPNGPRLGVLRRGADLVTLEARGQWLRVALHGYFWAASASGSGDVRKVAKPTENLRIAPGSEVVGELSRGTALGLVGRAGKWLEVSLEGWIWAPSTLSLGVGGSAPGGRAPESSGAEPAIPVADVAQPLESAPAGDASISDAGRVAKAAATDGAEAITTPPRILERSVPLKDSPGGALVGHALTGSSVLPLRSAGDWVKIRLEGWVPRDALAAIPAPSGPVTVAMVVGTPYAYRGARVTWALELIAVEKADEGRSDFSSGEHYLLTRSAVGEREYVYVTIPERLVAKFEELPAFTPLTVRGEIRTGRSALVGNPIVELQTLLDASP
jgi:hypothetical protein